MKILYSKLKVNENILWSVSIFKYVLLSIVITSSILFLYDQVDAASRSFFFRHTTRDAANFTVSVHTDKNTYYLGETISFGAIVGGDDFANIAGETLIIRVSADGWATGFTVYSGGLTPAQITGGHSIPMVRSGYIAGPVGSQTICFAAGLTGTIYRSPGPACATVTVIEPDIDGDCGVLKNTCDAGTFSNTPDTPTDYKWSCLGIGGGADASCTLPKPVTEDGSCGALPNTCSAGDYDDLPDNATNHIWQCLGKNGGIDSPVCSVPKLVDENGVCGAALNACSGGSLNDLPDDASNYLWQCLGIGTGSDSPVCSLPKAVPTVDGQCSFFVNSCFRGIFDDVPDTATNYRWNCLGFGPGHSDASCSLPKPILCGGSIPANASRWDAEEESSVPFGTNWTYADPDTATKCQYRCDLGYEWLAGSCVREGVNLSAEDDTNIPAGATVRSAIDGTWNNIRTRVAIKNEGLGEYFIADPDITIRAVLKDNPVFRVFGDRTESSPNYNGDINAGTHTGFYTQNFNNVPFGMHEFCTRVNIDGPPTFVEDGTDVDNQHCDTYRVEVPEPPISITANRDLVREGQSVNVAWSAHTSYPMDCEVRGPGGVNVSFDASDSDPLPVTGNQLTAGLQNTAEYTISCTEPTMSVTFSKSVVVEVVPNYEEI